VLKRLKEGTRSPQIKVRERLKEGTRSQQKKEHVHRKRPQAQNAIS